MCKVPVCWSKYTTSSLPLYRDFPALINVKIFFAVTGVSRVNTRRRRPFIKVDNNENFDYSPVDYNGDNNDYGDYGYDYNDADGLVSFNTFSLPDKSIFFMQKVKSVQWSIS